MPKQRNPIQTPKQGGLGLPGGDTCAGRVVHLEGVWNTGHPSPSPPPPPCPVHLLYLAVSKWYSLYDDCNPKYGVFLSSRSHSSEVLTLREVMGANEWAAKSERHAGSPGALDLQLMSDVGAAHLWGLH